MMASIYRLIVLMGIGFGLMVGCSPKFIYLVEGQPYLYPKEINTSWSADGSIFAIWYFSYWDDQGSSTERTEDVKFNGPNYLLAGDFHILPTDTRHVLLNIDIYNRFQKPFRIIKQVTVSGKTAEDAIGGWTFAQRLSLVIPSPVVTDEVITFSVKILSGEKADKDEKIETIISTDELLYAISATMNTFPVGVKGGDEKTLLRHFSFQSW